MDWQKNLITKDEDIIQLAGSAIRVAVLGIRSEAFALRPAFYVPKYLFDAGLDVIPVPVYEPEVTEILGVQVYRRVADVPGEIDILDVFRRAHDIPSHLPDIIEKGPKSVWFQLGIRNDEAAETLAKAGIKVVQDRCLKVDHRRALMMNRSSL
jgi:predicted CoA-binding protein